MTDNLALWNRHRTPHEDALKNFTKRGGFRGTAIDPMWSIRAATHEWGPMGTGWGYTVVSETVNTFSDDWVLHTVSIYLWYDTPQTLVPSTGSTWLIANGKPDDEAPKKSRTDALTKALSWLGFGADIYMGMHDGSKYADLNEEENVTPTQDDVVEESERPGIEESEHNLNVVKLNIKSTINLIGEEKYKVWHDRVLSNFYGVDSIEKLSVDELKDFADKQEIKIKEHKE